MIDNIWLQLAAFFVFVAGIGWLLWCTWADGNDGGEDER